jgi:hypothetical protein
MNSSNARDWINVLTLDWRLLTFRASRDELLGMTSKHLVFGLLCAWIVGMGRYWDNSRVGILQHLGIGSVIYVFVLSLFLWSIIWPLRPQNWSYLRVATFISLVSPPAILYAIPGQLFSSSAAQGDAATDSSNDRQRK